MKVKTVLNEEEELKRWQIVFGDLVKYVENGKGKILGRFYGIITFVVTGATYLSVTGQTIPFSEVVYYTIILTISLTFLGWCYSKFGFLKAEQSRLNEESPQIMEILRTVRRLEKNYEEMKQLKQV